MSTWTPFNINDYVRVQLTEHGRAVHRAQYDLLVAHLKPIARDDFPYSAPKEDEDGWSEWQMWSLMNTFGPHMWMTGQLCFLTDIQFETK